MNDLPALIASWRTYRRMRAEFEDARMQAHYERLIASFAYAIRKRLGYDT